MTASSPAAAYGDVFADVYDDWYPRTGEDELAVDFVVEMAGRDPVLELGVGTGRLACPIAERGVPIWGIDASEAMIRRLLVKPQGPEVRLAVGDMTELLLPADAPEFAVIFAAFNTFFCLPSRAAQAACLQQVASRLNPHGRLVIEAFIPPSLPTIPGAVEVMRLSPEGVVLKVSKWTDAGAIVTGQHIEISASGIRLRPWEMHPLRVEEIDAMAAEASLDLESRYSGWDRTPFGPTSRQHVSIYKKTIPETHGLFPSQ